MYGVYRTYVERGNTALLDLPYWVAEVTSLVGEYEAQRDVRPLKQRREREKQHEMLRKAGLMR